MKYFLRSSRSGILLVRNIRQRALPRTSYDEGKTEIIKFVQKRHERPKRDSQFFDEDLQNLTKLDAADLLKERERFKLRRQEMINTQRNFDNIPIVDQAVIMFPGIGHQHLKMGEKVIDNAASLRLFQEANEILNFDLLNLCLNGPKTLLDQPINATLATFVSSLAAFEKMKSEQPDLMERFTDCAGFGIGEFTALVAADVLKFTDALKVLKNYAQAAQECAQIVPSGMLTIRTCAKSQLRKALTEAKEYSKSKGEPPICDIAAYLFSHVKVIGGTMKSLEHFVQNAEHFQIQVIKRLPVFAAYNTAVMKQAATELHNFFPDSSMIQVPQINVYSNYSGRPHAAKPHQIRRDLIRQITKPVKWEQIAQELFRKHKDFNFPSYFEVGPGKQLGTLLNQVSKKTQKTYLNYPA